jgi:hypothetical protein
MTKKPKKPSKKKGDTLDGSGMLILDGEAIRAIADNNLPVIPEPTEPDDIDWNSFP